MSANEYDLAFEYHKALHESNHTCAALGDCLDNIVKCKKGCE